MDENVRQRIKFLLEHGGVWSEDPPVTRRCLLAIGGVVIALELLEIALHLAA